MMPTVKPTILLALLVLAFSGASAQAGQLHGPAAARYPVPPRLSARYGTSVYGPALRAFRPAAVWVPAHQTEVTRRVWVPGRTRREWVPPLYQTRFDSCGRPYTVCVRAGHWRTVCEPGHYENRVERVWVPGRWEASRR